MPFLFVHATAQDIDLVRRWINESRDVAWIIKAAQTGRTCTWKAVDRMDSIAEQRYAIWHIASGPLNVPSGRLDQPDAMVSDPFEGWTQTLNESDDAAPWFGANLPGPFNFTFQQRGIERSGSLGRSTFEWPMDRYASIGKPAHPGAKRWWSQLRRFLTKSAEKIPFPSATSRFNTFVFPDALQQHRAGRHLDVNQ